MLNAVYISTGRQDCTNWNV